jgi:hypothetical protein
MEPSKYYSHNFETPVMHTQQMRFMGSKDLGVASMLARLSTVAML